MRTVRASKTLLKELRGLTRKKDRDREGTFLVEGWKSVEELLGSDWKCELLLFDADVAEERTHDDLLTIASKRIVRMVTCSAAELKSVSATEHSQGIVAVVRQRSWAVEACDRPGENVLIALDGVADPGNVGTCIRTADWFGAGGVLLSAGCASLYNEKVVRATTGSLFHFPCIEDVDVSSALDRFRTLGYRILGTDVASGQSYLDVTAGNRIVLVLGNEARGLSPDVRERVDVSVNIPSKGRGESLNVAISGAILLAHFTKEHGMGEL